MGTRGATGFVLNGKWYVMYNHFDSYPEYLGMRVLEFCKTIVDWNALKERVAEIELVEEDARPTKEQIEKYKIYADLTVSERSYEDWYCLFRSLQGVGILEAIAKGWVQNMIDGHMFLADSLFCEWAYIIDLDEMGLRVYKGFNKEAPSPKHFNFLPPDVDKSQCNDMGYYPVKLLYTYNLEKLPEFMLGVTNKFKAEYRAKSGQIWD